MGFGFGLGLERNPGVSQSGTSILSSSVDVTGLNLAEQFSVPIATGTGSPTLTADGNTVTLGIPVLTNGGATWTYPITNGNPGGNPVVNGAVCKLNAAAGVWAGVSAVVNADVTNNSTVASLSLDFSRSTNSMYLSII